MVNEPSDSSAAGIPHRIL